VSGRCSCQHRLAPRAALRTPQPQPHISHFTLHTAHMTPRTSHLTPHPPRLTPHSPHTPRSVLRSASSTSTTLHSTRRRLDSPHSSPPCHGTIQTCRKCPGGRTAPERVRGGSRIAGLDGRGLIGDWGRRVGGLGASAGQREGDEYAGVGPGWIGWIGWHGWNGCRSVSMRPEWCACGEVDAIGRRVKESWDIGATSCGSWS
jgi:hypothetical protein